MSIIEELTKNVLNTSFESFDKDVVEQAKNRILDVVGCAIGGANASGCGMIVDLVKRWGGEKESTIMVHGGKLPAQNAAMVNCIMCRSYDFEPVGPYVYDMNIPAHISGTTVPTAIAVAEQNAASGKELITALILGDDLTSRMLAASRYSLDLGWDETGTVNMFGATAIAGRLMGLDERQMLNAFGIVLNQMAGSFQNIYDGVHCFKLLMGLAACAGIVSAEMASKGFTGIKDPLLSKYGYFGLYCQGYDPEFLNRDLGKKFFADSTLCIAAGGTLGILIPPSACMIVYGIITEQSISELFIAGIFPGILLAILFMVTIYILAKVNPELGPSAPAISLREKLTVLMSCGDLLFLFLLVMGGLYIGFFTPSEAGAVGAAGAFFIGLVRKKLGLKGIGDALIETIQTTAMVFVIIIGAMIFNRFLAITTIPFVLAGFIGGLSVPPIVTIIVIFVIYLILGCFIDVMAMMLLTMPIFFPVILAIGIDPIWFGVVVVIVSEMGLITPPVGMNVYVIKGVAEDVPLHTVFRGILPFLIPMVVCTAILMAFPQIALFLPGTMK